MQQITINNFEDTTSVNIPKDTAYVEIVSYREGRFYYENVDDSFLFKVIYNANFNTLVFSKENFTNDMFPLILTTFSNSDLEGGSELFNKSFGIPYGIMRLAVGRRNRPSKNITFENITKYINEGGSAYVDKTFTGLDFEEARQNLNVYSKGEIDALQNEYMFSNVVFNLSRNDALRFGDTYTGYPFLETTLMESGRYNAHNTFHSWFKGGVCGFELKFLNVKSYIEYRDNPHYFCDIQTLFNGRQFTTQVPLIIKPSVYRNGSANERPFYQRKGVRYGNTVALTNPTAADIMFYPVMVITPDYDINFANSILRSNSVYFVDLAWGLLAGWSGGNAVEPTGTSWYSSTSTDSTKYNFEYKITFMPNDPQLN